MISLPIFLRAIAVVGAVVGMVLVILSFVVGGDRLLAVAGIGALVCSGFAAVVLRIIGERQ